MLIWVGRVAFSQTQVFGPQNWSETISNQYLDKPRDGPFQFPGGTNQTLASEWTLLQ